MEREGRGVDTDVRRVEEEEGRYKWTERVEEEDKQMKERGWLKKEKTEWNENEEAAKGDMSKKQKEDTVTLGRRLFEWLERKVKQVEGRMMINQKESKVDKDIRI